MDPLAVGMNYFVWESGGLGLYFGIPISNFVGWWILVFIIAMVYFIIFDPLCIRPYLRAKQALLDNLYKETTNPFMDSIYILCCFLFWNLQGHRFYFIIPAFAVFAFTNTILMGPIVLFTLIKLLYPTNQNKGIE